MAFYIKTNQLAAAYFGHLDDRLAMPDGTYMLYQGDVAEMAAKLDIQFTTLYETAEEVCERIGGIIMQPEAVMAEQQDTEAVTELPVASDPRFVIEEELVETDGVELGKETEDATEVDKTDNTVDPAEEEPAPVDNHIEEEASGIDVEPDTFEEEQP